MEDVVINIVLLLLVVFVGVVAKSGESALNKRKQATGNKGLFREVIDEYSQTDDEYPANRTEQYDRSLSNQDEWFAGYTSTYTVNTPVEPEPFLTTELGGVATPYRGLSDEKQQASRSTMDDSSVIGQNVQEVQAETALNNSDSVEQDFDLRSAVIYSEILSPKFNDLA
ncbi:MAG: hypothetical protein ACI35T_02710 [Alistipes sp.]